MTILEPANRSPLLNRLQATPAWFICALSVALIAGTGAADLYSSNDVAFTAIYLLPISLVAWFLSRPALLAVTFLCAGTWLVVDLASPGYSKHPAIELVNLVLDLSLFLSFGMLLTMLRQRLAVEQKLARTDALTGLRNRRAFWDDAEQELERCRRFGQPFSIAYIDVNNFKGINDRLGHRAGDEMLQAIASTLQRSIRRIDIAARLGGDEFALLLPGTDTQGAGVLLGKISEQLATGLQATFRVGCSIGCLTVLDATKDVDELVARADAVMYEAKRSDSGQPQHRTYPEQHEPRGVAWKTRSVSRDAAS